MFACCAKPGEALAQEAPPSGSAEPTGTQELAKKLINPLTEATLTLAARPICRIDVLA